MNTMVNSKTQAFLSIIGSLFNEIQNGYVETKARKQIPIRFIDGDYSCHEYYPFGIVELVCWRLCRVVRNGDEIKGMTDYPDDGLVLQQENCYTKMAVIENLKNMSAEISHSGFQNLQELNDYFNIKLETLFRIKEKQLAFQLMYNGFYESSYFVS